MDNMLGAGLRPMDLAQLNAQGGAATAGHSALAVPKAKSLILLSHG